MIRLCELPSERKSPVVILAKAGDLAVGGGCVYRDTCAAIDPEPRKTAIGSARDNLPNRHDHD